MRSLVIAAVAGACAVLAVGAPAQPAAGVKGFYGVRQEPDGRWRAVDPSGRPFTVFGVDHVTAGWPQTNRLVRAFGTNAAFYDWTAARLKEWGFNTLGVGNDAGMRGRGFAHADHFDFASRTFATSGGADRRLAGIEFPNVFHPDYEAYCDARAASRCAPQKDDRELLGYFLANELDWLMLGRRDTGMFEACAAMPASSHEHKALVAFLAARGVTSVAAADDATKLAFLRHVADRFFSVQCAAIRRHDPNHLVLGCRFAGLKGAHDVVWASCAEHCDVTSFNCYPYADLDRGAVFCVRGNEMTLADGIRAKAKACGYRPMLVTEWGFPALDAHLPCTTGCGTRYRTQEERTEAMMLFARTVLSLPFMIGYDVFMWCDETPEGLTADFVEDSNYGLVNLDRKPYERLVKALAAFQKRDRARLEAEPLPRPAPPPFVVPVAKFLDAAGLPGKGGEARFTPTLTVAAGSSNLVDAIASGGEDFGFVRLCVALRSAEGLNFWPKMRRVTAVRTVSGFAGGAGREVTFAFGEPGGFDGGEATFRFTTWPGKRAFLTELTSLKNTAVRPYALVQMNVMLRAPFKGIDLLEAVPGVWKKPQRAAWHAVDGRWIGAASASASAYDFTCGLDMKGNRSGAFHFTPPGGHAVAAGAVSAVPDAWMLFLMDTDGRAGWREATDRLPIHPDGDPVKNRAARREIRTTLNGVSVLRGGRPLDPRAFRPVRDAATLRRLPPESVGKVLELDLTDADLADWNAQFAKGPVDWGAAGECPRLPMLFADGKHLTLARWPNGGAWAHIAAFDEPGRYAAGEVTASLGQGKKKRLENPPLPSFFYDGDRPARWVGAKDVLLHAFWCYDWYDSVSLVGKIEPEAKRIRLAAYTDYGIRRGNPSPRRWRAFNLVEELDEPGEYAVDRTAKKIYFLPPEGFGPDSRVSLASGNGVLFSAKGLKDVEFRDLVIEEGSGFGVRLEDCENVVFRNCTFRNLRREAATFVNCRHCAVVNCTAEHLGRGAFWFRSGDRVSLTRGENLVENCTIRDFNELFVCDGEALQFTGVGDTARGNFIANSRHIAVWMRGNDMTFERNVVSNVCKSADDAGAYYQGRDASARGNVLRYNTWIDVGSDRGHGNAAVYFDDGDGGNLVAHDTFVRCGAPGSGGFGTIFSHGGHDNWVRDCTFVDCRRPFGSYPWPERRWSEFVLAPSQRKRFDSVVSPMTGRPYVTCYPELARRYEQEPESERRNHAVDCTLTGCPFRLPTKLAGETNPGVFSGNWELKRIANDAAPAPKTVTVPAGTGDDTAAVRAAVARLSDGDTLAFEDGKTYALQAGTNAQAVLIQRLRDLKVTGKAVLTCPDARADAAWLDFFQCQGTLEIAGLSFRGAGGAAVAVTGYTSCSATVRDATFDGPAALRFSSYGSWDVRDAVRGCSFLNGAHILAGAPPLAQYGENDRPTWAVRLTVTGCTFRDPAAPKGAKDGYVRFVGLPFEKVYAGGPRVTIADNVTDGRRPLESGRKTDAE